jgi:hypothetical protein
MLVRVVHEKTSRTNNEQGVEDTIDKSHLSCAALVARSAATLLSFVYFKNYLFVIHF